MTYGRAVGLMWPVLCELRSSIPDYIALTGSRYVREMSHTLTRSYNNKQQIVRVTIF